jgi:hypothetical protein
MNLALILVQEHLNICHNRVKLWSRKSIFCANDVQTFGLKTPKINKKIRNDLKWQNEKTTENSGFVCDLE